MSGTVRSALDEVIGAHTPADDRPSGPHHTLSGASLEIDIDTLSPNAWDAMVSGFADATYDQSACFSTAQWRRHESSQIIARDEGVVVGGAHVVILKFPAIRSGLAYVKSGPFWRRNNCEPSRRTYQNIIMAMVQHYCGNLGHYLSIAPRPHPVFYETECELLRQLGFDAGRENPDPVRFFVNTSLSEDEQLKSLDQKWRYNLKKSLKNDLEIRLFEGPEGIECFSRLHQEMVKRKDFYNTDPVALLPALTRDLPENLRPHVVMAFHNGQPMVGATIALLGDTALYQIGASSAAALPLRAGYALQWWIAQWITSKGVKWYDLGGAAGNDGLRQFKRGFVGKEGALVPLESEFNRWYGQREKMVASSIYALRSMHRRMRDAIFTYRARSLS